MLRTILLASTALAACGDPPPLAEPLAMTTRLIPRLRVALDVPEGWVADGTGQVLSGPPGTESFFTTLTVQEMPRATTAAETLPELLERVAGSLPGTLEADLGHQILGVVGDRPAVYYSLRLVLHETRRERVGAVVDAGAYDLDIALGADQALVEQALPILDAALASVRLF